MNVVTVTLPSGTLIIKPYPDNDRIWNLEGEKKRRKVMADAMRELTEQVETIKDDGQLVVRG